jgi:N-acetylneuraminic acid mutarotase
MFSTLILLLFTIPTAAAWSGILLDGWGTGGTQLYTPGNPPSNTADVPFGLTHRIAQAAVVLNGKAYFTGGDNSSDLVSNTVTIFDPATNTSTRGAPMNVPRYWHRAVAVNNTIIVCGGFNGNESVSSCEQYTESSNKWSMIADMPNATQEFVMLTLHNRVYTFGGSGRCTLSPTPVYMYDGHTWTARSSFIDIPHNDQAGVALDSDRALICGGHVPRDDHSCPFVSDCFIYSANGDSWTKAASMAHSRVGHEMVMFQGEMYLYTC